MEYYCCFVVFFVTLQKKEMDNRQATLELGTKPVGKLLMQYAIPAIIGVEPTLPKTILISLSQ